MRLGRSADKIFNRIATTAGMASTVLLVIMMMLTVVDVILRYFFDSPIHGSMELTEYLMVCVGTLGLAWCALQDSHIKVELLVNRLPSRYQNFINSFNYLLLMGISGVIAWRTFVRAGTLQDLGVASAMLDIPRWPFVIVVSFSYILLFLAAVALLIHAIATLLSKAVKQ